MTEPTEKPTPPVSRKSLLIAAGIVTTSLIAWPVYNSLTRPPAPPSVPAQNEGRIASPHPAAVDTAPSPGDAAPEKADAEKAAPESGEAAGAEAAAPQAPAEAAQPRLAPQAAAPAQPAAVAATPAHTRPATTATAAPAPTTRTGEKPAPTPPKTDPKEAAAPAPKVVAPKATAKEAVAPRPATEGKPAPQGKAAGTPPPIPYRVAPPTEAARPDGSSIGYRVQLGLFSNIDNAAALVQRLKKAGIAAQSETRVSVGPFTTRAEADEAMAQLKGMGLTPLLAPNGTQ